MQQRRRILSATLLVLALCIFLASAWRLSPPTIAVQDGPIELKSKTFCSDTQLRTPVVELTWRASQDDLDKQMLEVTEYKDGFKRGLLNRLTSVGRDQTFARVMPDNLRTEDAVQQTRLSLTKRVIQADGRVSIRITGLSPGINYSWRICSATNGEVLSEVVRSQSPICPADHIRE